MYESRNKTDLIIEVWEKLDCENVGASEIIAIENAVRSRFGEAAVDSPMIVARLLADEGAELRHSEIMELYVDRSRETPHDAELRNIISIDSLAAAERSIRQMENLRRKYADSGDREGIRLLRDRAVKAKNTAHENSLAEASSASKRMMYAEIAEWLTIWMQTPEVFESWVGLRKRSEEYRVWFDS